MNSTRRPNLQLSLGHLPFGGMADSKRTDNIPPGGSIHEETADLNAAVVTGWAQAQCSGPIQASALFRFSQDGVPQSEASVIAMTGLASQFVTFADQDTGVAYANPSTEMATITFTAKDTQGTIVGMPPIMLGAENMGPQTCVTCRVLRVSLAPSRLLLRCPLSVCR